MKLNEYIAVVGDAKAAEIFGVKLTTARSWRLGNRLPRPGQAKRIVRASHKRVDYEGIYGEIEEEADHE